MQEPLVVFNHVSKRFRRGERHTSLRDLVPALARRVAAGRLKPRATDEFLAVDDVSFEVRPGEALGIIGPNGAGKSTILKLLTRILKPSSGRCEVRGRTGALIEVAAGFHPDLTGRENVFLQGAIMGMGRGEIVRKFDEIVEFSGMGREFIETPVKRYSSGMNARLGFAIAAHLDPDVLVIDEILSVGDATFQDKCVMRMKALVGRGVPVVFVSHNLPAILQLCTRAIVLDHGRVMYDGSPEEAVREYRRGDLSARTTRPGGNEANGSLAIARVELVNNRGEAVETIRTGDAAIVRVEYLAKQPVHNPQFSVQIDRGDGTGCCAVNTLMDGHELGLVSGRGTVEFAIERLPLLSGCYLLSVGIMDAQCVNYYDLRERVVPFSVVSTHKDRGLVYLEHSWRHRAGNNGFQVVRGAPFGGGHPHRRALDDIAMSAEPARVSMASSRMRYLKVPQGPHE
jgi:lipopolysaccharide transport system ATP-binding protein